MKDSAGILYFCRVVDEVRSSLNHRPPTATACGFGLKTSNQSSPEEGAAIHSLIFRLAGSPRLTAELGEAALGITSVQLVLPLGKRPMARSSAWRPNVTKSTGTPLLPN